MQKYKIYTKSTRLTSKYEINTPKYKIYTKSTRLTSKYEINTPKYKIYTKVQDLHQSTRFTPKVGELHQHTRFTTLCTCKIVSSIYIRKDRCMKLPSM